MHFKNVLAYLYLFLYLYLCIRKKTSTETKHKKKVHTVSLKEEFIQFDQWSKWMDPSGCYCCQMLLAQTGRTTSVVCINFAEAELLIENIFQLMCYKARMVVIVLLKLRHLPSYIRFDITIISTNTIDNEKAVLKRIQIVPKCEIIRSF